MCRLFKAVLNILLELRLHEAGTLIPLRSSPTIVHPRGAKEDAKNIGAEEKGSGRDIHVRATPFSRPN